MLTLISAKRATTYANDQELVVALRRGDATAYEQLVRDHGGVMLAVARRYLRSEDDARDVVQEAMLSAFRGIVGFAADAKLSTWLHRIVVNCALMRLRSRRRRPEESIDDLLPRFDEQGAFVAGANAWEEPATETLIERRELRQVVRACIDRLPAGYRELLLLRDIEELDTDESAALLGLSVAAVKSRLHRARQALRTLLVAELGLDAALEVA